MWKTGLFWNIKAKSFSIFFWAEVLFEKKTGTWSFFQILFISTIFLMTVNLAQVVFFIPWFFWCVPARRVCPQRVFPPLLEAADSSHFTAIITSLRRCSLWQRALSFWHRVKARDDVMMTGDDGRDGRLMYLAFFFWGGYDGVDDGSWGRSFIVDYLKVFERFLFVVFFFRLAKRNHSFSKAFFWADFWCVFIFWRQTGRHDILEVSINLRWQNLPKNIPTIAPLRKK